MTPARRGVGHDPDMRVRVATVNVQHGRSWTRRVDVEQLASSIRSLGADVVGYQEIDKHTPRVGHRHLPALLAQATDHTVVFGTAVRLGPVGRYGVALGAPPGSWQAGAVKLPGRRGLEPRIAVVADPVVNGVRIIAVAAHLAPDRQLAPVQLAELDGIAQAAGPPPHVILADVNMAEGAWRPVLARWGFDSAVAAPTFPAARPRHRIDVVAIRGGTVTSAWTRRIAVSDHRALVADLDVETPT